MDNLLKKQRARERANQEIRFIQIRIEALRAYATRIDPTSSELDDVLNRIRELEDESLFHAMLRDGISEKYAREYVYG